MLSYQVRDKYADQLADGILPLLHAEMAADPALRLFVISANLPHGLPPARRSLMSRALAALMALHGRHCLWGLDVSRVGREHVYALIATREPGTPEEICGRLRDRYLRTFPTMLVAALKVQAVKDGAEDRFRVISYVAKRTDPAREQRPIAYRLFASGFFAGMLNEAARRAKAPGVHPAPTIRSRTVPAFRPRFCIGCGRPLPRPKPGAGRPRKSHDAACRMRAFRRLQRQSNKPPVA